MNEAFTDATGVRWEEYFVDRGVPEEPGTCATCEAGPLFHLFRSEHSTELCCSCAEELREESN